MNSKFNFFILISLFFLFTVSTSFAYAQFYPLQPSRANESGVWAWFKQNDLESLYTFRFAGIEVLPISEHKPSTQQVSDFVKHLTRSECYVEFDKEQFVSAKVYKAYIWSKKPDGEITEQFIRDNLINAKLVSEGYARVLEYGPNQKYLPYLLKFQEEAKNNRLGIWK